MKYRYPFTNEIVFSLVMQNPRFCRGILQLIFPERSIREVKLHDLKIEAEKSVIVGIESKKIRLDVLFEGDNEWYDIEMQVRNEKNIPKRSRYSHGIMDVYQLDPGQDYNELKTGYVIFLCCFDPFDRGDAVYNFQMLDREKDLSLGDEQYTILLNSKADRSATPEPLQALFRYMNESIVSGDDALLHQIDASVQSWNTGEGVNVIMTLEQEILIKEAKAREEGLKEGYDKGRNEARLQMAKMLKDDGLSVEAITRYTGLTEEKIKEL